MKLTLIVFTLLLATQIPAQTTIKSKTFGKLEFVELEYGLAKVEAGSVETLPNTPTRTHGWLKDFQVIKASDSIQAEMKANFGIVYMIKARDTADIEVVIEWIFPQKITNENGESFKSVKYSTQRPTNIPSASSYSLDAPYELVKGEWQVNFYLERKKVYSRSFYLY